MAALNQHQQGLRKYAYDQSQTNTQPNRYLYIFIMRHFAIYLVEEKIMNENLFYYSTINQHSHTVFKSIKFS